MLHTAFMLNVDIVREKKTTHIQKDCVASLELKQKQLN